MRESHLLFEKAKINLENKHKISLQKKMLSRFKNNSVECSLEFDSRKFCKKLQFFSHLKNKIS